MPAKFPMDSGASPESLIVISRIPLSREALMGFDRCVGADIINGVGDRDAEVFGDGLHVLHGRVGSLAGPLI